MTVHTRAFVVAAAMIWVTAAACDNSSPTPAAPSTLAAPPPVTTTDLRIDGPTSLAPGAMAQFSRSLLYRATGRLVTSPAKRAGDRRMRRCCKSRPQGSQPASPE
jgi:hypothetical protein